MASLSRFVALSALGALAAVSFGQSFTGTWKGHIDLTGAPIPKGQNAQQQQMIDKQIAMVKALVLTLTIKPNKTFTMSAPNMMTKKPSMQEGTWAQNGKSLKLTFTKNDGKPLPPSAKAMTLLVGANNKSLTLLPPGGAGGKVLFKR